MFQNKKMNLFFISSEQYPNGGAATNRHMAYTKGLAEAGHNITFILLAKQQIVFQNKDVNYISVYPKTNRTVTNKFVRLYFYLISIIRGRKLISNIYSREKIDAIIFLDTLVWVLFPFILTARKHRIKTLHERTEYPFVVTGRSFISRLGLLLYTKYVLRKFDGLYVISKSLKKYFNELLTNKVPIEVINMIVDPSRFENVITDLNNNKYIAYCGTLQGDKDGVDILIKAFGKALSTGKINNNLKLYLIGDNSDIQLQKRLRDIAEENHCQKNIIFTGKVDRDKVPSLLTNASALVLSRPNNKQAEGGFPTKLGEYLATGNPVIITKVGAISEFLMDGENAFIAIPNSVDSFSDKIHEVFSNYAKACQIGERGKKLVYCSFNYYHEALRLAKFIETI